MRQAHYNAGVMCSVSFVFSHRLPDKEELGIMQVVTASVGVHRSWTLEGACNADNPRVMRLLLGEGRYARIDPCEVARMSNSRLEQAARSGRLWVLEDFARYFPTLVFTEVAEAAVNAGHGHIVSWLMNNDRVVWRERACLMAAAAHGSISGVTRLLKGRRWKPFAQMLHSAVQRNHVDLLEWLWLDFSARDCTAILEEVIATVPLGTAIWMASRAPPSLKISIDAAATRGDLTWIKWANARGAVATVRAMDSAAELGHHEVLIWLHNNRREGCSATVIDHVAAYGHMSIIQWLHRTRCLSWSGDALLNAAVNGHLELLQWLWSSSDLLLPLATLDLAAAAGQLSVVEWMTTASVGEATHFAMDGAAKNGHYEVVCYLHNHRREGCTTNAMDGAAANGHFKVLGFLNEFRREGCTTAAFDDAARTNNYRVMEFLHALRSEGFTSLALRNAAASGSLETVRWLTTAFGLTVTTEVVDAAFASGNGELVGWLVQTFRLWVSKAGVDAAVAAGHFELLMWAQSEHPLYCSASALEVAVASGDLYLASWAFKHCDGTKYLDAGSSTFWSFGWTPTIVRNAFE